jgi:GT2 family glycosyltransferase
MAQRVAAVVIGRNEGERLRRCLTSIVGEGAMVVYVDSGSTDGSAEMAQDLGVTVISLDMNLPFTAARARNAGFRRLRDLDPRLSYVQFVDGDCEVVPGWLAKGAAFLAAHPEVSVVYGRRRERYPERSVYNMLCDIEWDTPIGESRACGGDALMRASAVEAMNGYRPDLIAGEEPDLCIRMRKAGWLIWRLDEEMTLHDAAMTSFWQWWRRALRSGHAFAQGSHLHGAPPERHYVAQSRRAWIWGLLFPIAVMLLAATNPFWLLLALAYPFQIVRLGLTGRLSPRQNWWRALFLVLARFPEVIGQLTYLRNRLAGKQSLLIEYK